MKALGLFIALQMVSLLVGTTASAGPANTCLELFSSTRAADARAEVKLGRWLEADLSESDRKALELRPGEERLVAPLIHALAAGNWQDPVFDLAKTNQDSVMRAALHAQKAGRISMLQVSTMALRWSFIQDFELTAKDQKVLTPVPLISRSGQLNPTIKAMIGIGAYVEKDSTGIQVGLSDEAIDAFKQEILSLPKSERFFWMIPHGAQTGIANFEGYGQLFARQGHSTWKLNLVRGRNLRTGEIPGITLDERQNLLFVHSLGTLQSYINASSRHLNQPALQLAPQIGLSKVSTLYRQVEANQRAFIINFPGVEQEIFADGFLFGRTLNSLHDFVHGFTGSSIPVQYRLATRRFEGVAAKFQKLMPPERADVMREAHDRDSQYWKYHVSLLARKFKPGLFFDFVKLNSMKINSLPHESQKPAPTLIERLHADFPGTAPDLPGRLLLQDIATHLSTYRRLGFPVEDIVASYGLEGVEIFANAQLRP
jgi:hypothetical protein